jgi:hypothetical protein
MENKSDLHKDCYIVRTKRYDTNRFNNTFEFKTVEEACECRDTYIRGDYGDCWDSIEIIKRHDFICYSKSK